MDRLSSHHFIALTSIIFLILCLQLFEWTVRSPSQDRYKPAPGLYQMKARHEGDNFFDGFNFEAIDDPTHGHVRYQSRKDSVNLNLTYISNGTAYIHTDHKAKAPQGRASVRLSTKQSYTRGLFVLDVRHMPVGCGTWPAFWSTAVSSWPNKGEIDIIEGVNIETDNAFTLHTGPGCRQPKFRKMTGKTETEDCYVHASNQWPNQGCGVKTESSYGSSFNENDGKIVVMEWTENVIRMWIFERDESPLTAVPEPASWRTPDAIFDDSECDIKRIFRDHVLIINTTLCGDWCGNVYASSPCPGSSCEAFVSDNPEAFVDAYWAIDSLRIYQRV